MAGRGATGDGLNPPPRPADGGVGGGPETVRAGLEAAVAASGADEVIAIANTSDPDERRAAYVRLAEAVGASG